MIIHIEVLRYIIVEFNPEDSYQSDESCNQDQQVEPYCSSPQQTSISNDSNTADDFENNEREMEENITDEQEVINNPFSLLCDLRDWACRNKCTRNQVNEL